MLSRGEVYKIIDGEREYQNEKWNENTTTSKGLHSVTEWLVYIQDYLSEAMHIVSRNADPQAAIDGMENIRKIAGMCVAAMEQRGVKPRQR